MAFSDPQTVFVDTVAQSLPRTGISEDTGRFTKEDGSYELLIGQQKGRRSRQSIRLTSRKTAPDVLNPVLNKDVSMSVTLVVDTPSAASGGGYSLTEKKQIVDALVAFLSASSGANVSRLLGGEI